MIKRIIFEPETNTSSHETFIYQVSFILPVFIGISPINAQHRKSANPILSGFHADPEILYSRQTKRYYIYPTSDGFPGWGGSYFKVFSSRNLKEWKEERVILDMKKDVSWANGNAWAPCIEEKEIDGKYKYFFITVQILSLIKASK